MTVRESVNVSLCVRIINRIRISVRFGYMLGRLHTRANCRAKSNAFALV